MPKYSVLIPAYNAEKYLEECVRSVELQNGCSKEWIQKEIEIMIADDGSTDNTLRICKKIASEFSNVTYFHKENEGQFPTRQYLLEQARGDYILYLDADDTWEPQLISVIETYLNNKEFPDMLIFGFNVCSGLEKNSYLHDKAVEHLKKPNEIMWKLFASDKYNSLCCKAIQRNLAKKILCPDTWKKIRQGEDRLFTLAYVQNCQYVIFLPYTLYNYRIDNSSITRNFYPQYFEDVVFVETQVYPVLVANGNVPVNKMVEWAGSLIRKFNDYIFSAYNNLEQPKEWILKYHNAEVLNCALNILLEHGSIMQKLYARLIKRRWYGVVYTYFKIKKGKNR